MTQERYYTYMLRRYKEEMEELREDQADYKMSTDAIQHYAAYHNMTIQQVQAMIQESPEAKRLVMNYYWEKRTL